MKKKYLIVLIVFTLILSGCRLDGWDALGIMDGVLSTATGGNDSDPTPIPTKSEETIQKENKVTEILEQDNLGYDLAYAVKVSGSDRFESVLIDFDRMVKTTISGHRESSSASIVTQYIGGSEESEWYVLDSKTKEKTEYGFYSRINKSGEKPVVEEFQIQDNGEEKIIYTRIILDLGECAEFLRSLLPTGNNQLERQYDNLFPREP